MVPNNKRFKVYRAKNFSDFSNNSFIGYWDPLGKENNYTFDSPEIITPDIRKKIDNGSSLEILYFILLDEGWVTKIIKYENLGIS